jgi:hypothetical protein
VLILRRFALAALPSLLVVFSPAIAEGNPILSAPFVTVAASTTVTIPIEITGATELTSWQFDLAFDPLIVKATLVTEGPFMSDFGLTSFNSPGVIDNLTGLITVVSASYADLTPNPSGSGTLAFVEFQALAMGVSPLQFSNVFLNFSDQDFTLSPGAITVSNGPVAPVPDQPSTLALVAIGLALLHGYRHAHSTRIQGER